MVTGIQIRWAFGGASGGVLADLARAVCRELAVVAVGFGPSAVLVLVLGTDLAVMLVAVGVAMALTTVATAVAWPREARAFLGLLPARAQRA